MAGNAGLEDFADVDDFVQEDDALDIDQDEDEIEKRIAEEHSKYLEQQAKRQEEVRASRKWSAPPADSPRPEQQRERERERHELAKVDSSSLLAAPRSDYEPPPRPYLASAQNSAADLNYMSRPQSASSRAGSRVSNNGGRLHMQNSQLQGIAEESPEDTMGSRNPSHSSSLRQPATPEPPRAPTPDHGYQDDRSRVGSVREDGPPAEEVADEESGRASGIGAADEEEDQPSRSGYLGSNAFSPYQQHAGDDDEDGAGREVEEEGAAEGEEERQEQEEQEGDDEEREHEDPDHEAIMDHKSVSQQEEERPWWNPAPQAIPTPAAAASAGAGSGGGSFAMRGFVEPLGSFGSEAAAGKASGGPATARSHVTASAHDEDEKEDEDEYGDEEFEPEAEASAVSSSVRGGSVVASSVARPMSAGSPLVAASNSERYTPLSTPLRTTVSVQPPVEGDDEEEDREMYRKAAEATRMASATPSGAGSVASPSPAAAVGATATSPELLPPEQFAMQLLRHDIEVLPAHHKAKIEAAAAKKGAAAGKTAVAGLGTYGYLGFHQSPEGFGALAQPPRKASPHRGDTNGKAASPRTSGAGNTRLSGDSGSDGDQSGGGGDGGSMASPRGSARPASAKRAAGSATEASKASKLANPEELLVPQDELNPEQAPGQEFLGLARQLRQGKPKHQAWGPPTEKRLAAHSAVASGAGSAVEPEASLSVIDETELTKKQPKVRYDQWADAFSGKGGHHDEDAAGSSSSSRPRPARPMTAPAAGRRRPASAVAAGAGGGAGTAAAAAAAARRGRPMSAQPAHLTMIPESSLHGHGTAAVPTRMGPTALLDPAMASAYSHGMAAAPTAAVEVAGVTLSVYVADTAKRILEANRWLAQLGVVKRYRLKDRWSNMVVQLVEPPAPTLGEEDEEDHEAHSLDYANGGGPPRVVKELTLKQFLSAHARLKAQAAKLRMAYGPPLPPGAPMGGYMGGYDPSGRGRPASAGRVRPVSAASSGRAHGGQATVAGTTGMYFGGLAAAGGAGGGSLGRPSSARPAYGRTSYGGGATVPVHPAGGGGAIYRPWSGGPTHGSPGSAGFYTLTVPTTVPVAPPAYGSAAPAHGGKRNSHGGVPRPGGHLHREDGTDEEILLEDDGPEIDTAKLIRQQLAEAAGYCRDQRRQIAQLRTMPSF